MFQNLKSMAKFTCILWNFRKKIAGLLLLFLLFYNNLFATGSLITSRNYYFFKEPSYTSQRYYIPRHQAFNVLDLYKNKEGQYFFLVKANVIKKKEKKIGFVFVNTTLKKDAIVQVFQKIPEKTADILNYYNLASLELKFIAEAGASKIFPFQNWYKVTYNFDVPEEVWVSESVAIYRFDKSALWLSTKFQELAAEGIARKKKNKILAGIVDKTYSKKEVLLTLGLPLETSEKNNLVELIYKDRKIILKQNIVTQIILNKE